MSIEIFPNKITFGTFELTITPTGIGTNSEKNPTRSRGGFTASSYQNIVPANNPYQGTVAGFAVGGVRTSPPPTPLVYNKIERFPFSSDSNATNVGSLTVGRRTGGGNSSSTHGYQTLAEAAPGVPGVYTKDTTKFSFATYASSVIGTTDFFGPYAPIGGGFIISGNGNGRSSNFSSSTSGYVSGSQPPGLGRNGIAKFPFATDANSTIAGKSSRTANYEAAGISGTDVGYIAGGSTDLGGSSGTLNTIEKFYYATEGTSSVISKLINNPGLSQGDNASGTHGYVTGGGGNVIQKFPFATDADATDVGDLFQAVNLGASQSSTTHGYQSGGQDSGVTVVYNVIQKFPFATDTNASDVGDLSVLTLWLSSGQSD